VSPRMVLRPFTPAVVRAAFAGERPVALLAGRATVFGTALLAPWDGDFPALRVPAPATPGATVVVLDLAVARPAAFFAVALRDVAFLEARLAAPTALEGLVVVDFLAIALLLAGVAFPATFLVATFLAAVFLTTVFLATFLAGALLLDDLLAPVVLLEDLRGLVVAMRHLPS